MGAKKDDDPPRSHVEQLFSSSSGKKQISFYLERDLYERFKKLCQTNKLSASRVISALIRDFIDRYDSRK